MKVNFNRIIIPTSRDDNINLLTKFIQCKICMNLLNDPYDCLCCNQTFCKSCIVNYIKANNKCPFSEFFDLNIQKEKSHNKKLNIPDLLNRIKPSSSNFSKIIQSLKFYCQNNDKGCNIELNIEEISEHEKICKYREKRIKVELKKNNNKNSINSLLINKKESRDKKNNILYEKFNSFDSNNDLLQDNTYNKIKQQDSVVSFSGIKYFSDNKDINQFYSNENSVNNNIKIEKSIDEINKKLSFINSFIINNYDNKYNNNENKSKSKKIFDTELSDCNKNENNDIDESKDSKIVKRNSMTITNNFYDGSYINNVNNFTNDNLNSHNYFKTINENIENKIMPFTTKQFKYSTKREPKINDKKNYFTSKTRKNTKRLLLEDKSNKNKNVKNKKKLTNNKSEVKEKTLEEINKQEKQENITKDDIFLKNHINNIIATDTPKLGGKTQSYINSVKPFDFNLNLNIENNNKNNCIIEKNDENISNENIFNGIKKLNSKMTDIERLLQTNNSFKNQTYSIQTEDLFGDSINDDSVTKGNISIKSSIKEIQNLKNIIKDNINNNKVNEDKNDKNETDNNENEKKLNDENILKKIEELISKIEDNIKNILKDRFDNLKKYIENQLLEDIKKCVLDTNFDIMTLYNDKLVEFENLLNEKLNNLKF